MSTYYIITATIDGESEKLFGSFNRDDCISELECEKDSWKAEGYKRSLIGSEFTTDQADPEVYPELYTNYLINDDHNEVKKHHIKIGQNGAVYYNQNINGKDFYDKELIIGSGQGYQKHIDTARAIHNKALELAGQEWIDNFKK